MQRARSGQRAGFSILELAIVLTLITVAAAIAIPLFYGRATVTLDNAARLLRDDLRAAQNHAVVAGKDVLVQFYPGGDGYRIVDEDGVPLPHPAGGGDFQRRYSADGVFEGVRLERVDLAGQRTAHYTREGYALYGGELELSFRDERRRLTLEPSTGLMQIHGGAEDEHDDGR